MEETLHQNAIRRNLTSVVQTNIIKPVIKRSLYSEHETYLSQDENLTDHDFDTDNFSLSPINASTSSPLIPVDPIYGYKIDSISQIVGTNVFDIREIGSISKFISGHIEWGFEPGSFLVTNLTCVVNQFTQWQHELPMVEPFYAVKCNPDPAILRLLASLGCGFDCATMGEIDLVLNGLGDNFNFANRDLASSKIVYAQPAKMATHLQFAAENGVHLTVFDGEDELFKIASTCGGEIQNLKLLLRIATNDANSVCSFSHKFGARTAEAPRLLEIANSLGLSVVGVCFHVGSGCRDASAYTSALNDALTIFQIAFQLGMPDMSIIDIGGGFPGDTGGYGGASMPTFQDLSAVIRVGIDDFKGRLGRDNVRFIAEPGRYFASAATSVATKIYSRKGGDGFTQALYVDDGVYGSFNNILYDHFTPTPAKVVTKFSNASDGEQLAIPTVVFGPTCDGLDQLCITVLERCKVGEWLLWENMGAYTHTASFTFNGYTHLPTLLHVVA